MNSISHTAFVFKFNPSKALIGRITGSDMYGLPITAGNGVTSAGGNGSIGRGRSYQGPITIGSFIVTIGSTTGIIGTGLMMGSTGLTIGSLMIGLGSGSGIGFGIGIGSRMGGNGLIGGSGNGIGLIIGRGLMMGNGLIIGMNYFLSQGMLIFLTPSKRSLILLILSKHLDLV